jgi:predicted 3-demethylubiquinone-9 3-methyltransferase (glyoxalase superfamily)
MRGRVVTAIAPCLWFNGEAEEAANFYVSLFPNSAIDAISRYGETDIGIPNSFAPGTAMLVSFSLDGRPFQALNGGPEFPFTEAVSLSVEVEDEAELDRYWSALTSDGGAAGPCGWVKDRYGLSWQVVPRLLAAMHRGGERQALDRMMKAMMTMSKLDVAALEAAYRGDAA